MRYKIRSMFVAPKDHILIAMDLSQAETWVTAHLANESTMKYALEHSDIHTITASAFFNSPCTNDNGFHDWKKTPGDIRVCTICNATVDYVQRYTGKKNNHANSYRQGPAQLVRSVNAESDQPPHLIITLAQANKFNRQWHALYIGIKKWWASIENDLIRYDRVLTTPYGRKRTFYDGMGEPLLREATAHIPQSTVGDHALGAIQPELGIAGGILGISKLPDVRKYCKLIQTAHDSILLECPTEARSEIIPQVYGQFKRPLIVNDQNFTIPVDVEVGERWGELEAYDKSLLG